MSRLRPLHIALLIPWMVALVAARLPLRDNSFLWHVRVGTIQSETGSVLTQDPLSFTRAGEAWRTQGWLVELLYGWLDERLGLRQAAWLVAIGALLVAAALGLLIWRRSRSVVGLAISLAFSSWIMAAFMNPRPVLFSYILMVVVYMAAESPKLKWVLLPISWVWASVHASYVLGIALVGVVRFRQGRYKEAFKDAATMALASFLTAHGWGAVDFLVGFVGNREALSLLTEWSTPNFLSIAFLPVIGLVVAIVIAGMRGQLCPRDLWLVVFGVVLLFSASRSVLLGWIVLVPLASLAFTVSDDQRLMRGEAVGLGRVGWLLAFVVIGLPFVLPIASGFERGRFPVGIQDAIQVERNTYHDDIAGGYLAYAVPEMSIFIDDRAELYGADFFRELIETRSGTPTWLETFTKHEITQAIVRNDEALVGILTSDGWTTVRADEHFSLLIKR